QACVHAPQAYVSKVGVPELIGWEVVVIVRTGRVRFGWGGSEDSGGVRNRNHHSPVVVEHPLAADRIEVGLDLLVLVGRGACRPGRVPVDVLIHEIKFVPDRASFALWNQGGCANVENPASAGAGPYLTGGQGYREAGRGQKTKGRAPATRHSRRYVRASFRRRRDDRNRPHEVSLLNSPSHENPHLRRTGSGPPRTRAPRSTPSAQENRASNRMGIC